MEITKLESMSVTCEHCKTVQQTHDLSEFKNLDIVAG